MAPDTIVANRKQEDPKESSCVAPFSLTLARHGRELTRGVTTSLQINVGLRCNQACHHCHLEAGPDRREMMSWETVEEVARFARRGAFEVIDFTGGLRSCIPGWPR